MNHEPDEQQPWQTPAELQAIELQLRSLEPRTDRLDRERLIFLAGKASVEVVELPTARWAWPASLAAMTALAATLLVMLINVPAPAPTNLPSPEKSFAEIRQDLAEHRPSHQKPRGISTATIFHAEELESLLNGKHAVVASNDIQALSSEGSPLRHAILTSSSWGKLIDESIPAN